MLTHAQTDADLLEDGLVLSVVRHALWLQELPDVELMTFALLYDRGALDQAFPFFFAQDADGFEHDLGVQVAVHQQPQVLRQPSVSPHISIYHLFYLIK